MYLEFYGLSVHLELERKEIVLTQEEKVCESEIEHPVHSCVCTPVVELHPRTIAELLIRATTQRVSAKN